MTFGLDSQLLVNNILELFLKLNREFLQQPNETAKLLKRLDKKFTDRMENFYKEGNIQWSTAYDPLPNRWILKN